ncbi:MAG TPA: flagellar basal body-associated FliL family protein [Candidatus Saccharimonadales bacterium]|nr:flagellar basal body-associated FliL family protein [Candidatus Saccharimonadales bacterium]
MPANRTEALPAPDDVAAAPEASAPAPTPSGGFKAWLPLIVTFLVMPALAYAMTSWILLPRLQKGLGITPVAAESSSGSTSDTDVKTTTVPLNKLLVNVAGTMGSRYLLVSLSVVGTGADFTKKMQDNDAALRDMACGDLATKTIADLGRPDARNGIRSELLTGFNNILGNNCVKEIYLTEFAIQ